MDYFNTNLEYLKQIKLEIYNELSSIKNNNYFLQKTKKDNFTLLYKTSEKECFLHSKYDPEVEASRLISQYDFNDAKVVIFLGVGLMYHIEQALEKILENSFVILVEKDLEVLSLCLQARDLKNILTRKNFYLYKCNEESSKSIYELLAKTFHPRLPKERQVLFISHPPSLNINGEFYKNFTRMLRDKITYLRVTVNTVMNVGHFWPKNVLYNVYHSLVEPPIKTLFNKFKNIPIIIVSSGPSLNKNIHLLKEAKGKAILVAMGSTLKPLLNNGVEPDMVFSIDAEEINYRHFEGVLRQRKSVLIFDPMLYPKIIDDYEGPKLVARIQNDALRKHLENYVGEPGMLKANFSVATAALELGLLMGCNPIIFVGQDLSFAPDGDTHVKGTLFNSKLDFSSQESFLATPANNGGEVLTDPVFLSTIKWFEIYLESKPGDFINATEGGAFIKGTKVMTLSDTLNNYCKTSIDFYNSFLQIKQEYLQDKKTDMRKKADKLLNHLTEINEELIKYIYLAKKVWNDCEELLKELMSSDNIFVKIKQKEIVEKRNKTQALLVNLRKPRLGPYLEPLMEEVMLYLARTVGEQDDGLPPVINELDRAIAFSKTTYEAANEILPNVQKAIKDLENFK